MVNWLADTDTIADTTPWIAGISVAVRAKKRPNSSAVAAAAAVEPLFPSEFSVLSFGPRIKRARLSF